MENQKVAEMADRYDRIYNSHWESLCQFIHPYYLQNPNPTLLDDYDMPDDIKEVVLVWGGANARRYLKEKAPNMDGVTLEELTKTALGLKALKSVLIEINFI